MTRTFHRFVIALSMVLLFTRVAIAQDPISGAVVQEREMENARATERPLKCSTTRVANSIVQDLLFAVGEAALIEAAKEAVETPESRLSAAREEATEAGGFSYILGRRLLQNGLGIGANGSTRPFQVAAHHLVAWDDPRAGPAQAVLKHFGVDIHSHHNGAFLPKNMKAANPNCSTVHSVVHTDKYYAEVNKRLAQATSASDVTSILSKIRLDLISKAFPF